MKTRRFTEFNFVNERYRNNIEGFVWNIQYPRKHIPFAQITSLNLSYKTLDLLMGISQHEITRFSGTMPNVKLAVLRFSERMHERGVVKLAAFFKSLRCIVLVRNPMRRSNNLKDQFKRLSRSYHIVFDNGIFDFEDWNEEEKRWCAGWRESWPKFPREAYKHVHLYYSEPEEVGDVVAKGLSKFCPPPVLR